MTFFSLAVFILVLIAVLILIVVLVVVVVHYKKSFRRLCGQNSFGILRMQNYSLQ